MFEAIGAVGADQPFSEPGQALLPRLFHKLFAAWVVQFCRVAVEKRVADLAHEVEHVVREDRFHLRHSLPSDAEKRVPTASPTDPGSSGGMTAAWPGWPLARGISPATIRRVSSIEYGGQ